MRITTLFILMILSLFGVTAAGSALHRTGHLYKDTRVSAGNYKAFCQDHDGFMWIGTDRGLYRFDGNNYDVYRHDDLDPGSLSDNRILSLLCDSKGRVWVATANGLNLYRPETDSFDVITIPAKSFLGYIIDVGEQSDGTVTFIMSGVGLYVVSEKGESPEAVRYTFGDEDYYFNCMACSPTGKIFMGSHLGDVYAMSLNGKLARYKVTDGTNITCVSLEADGNLLISTFGAVYRLRADTGETEKLHTDFPLEINYLSNTDGGRVYVSTKAHGLLEVRTGAGNIDRPSRIYCPFLDIEDANIGAVCNAPDGNLWLGCNYTGLMMVPGKDFPFVYRKLTDAFPDFNGGMNALAVWRGNVIAGLDRGHIVMLSPYGEALMKTSVPGGGNVTDISVTDGDTAYVSVTDNGIWQMDLPSGSLKKVVDIPGKFSLIVTAPGKKGELFIGVHGGGLMRYNLATGERFRFRFDRDGNQYTNPFIACLTRTPDEKIWIGLYGGIACYDLKAGKMLEIDQQPFLKGATFSIVPCLTDESVWVGTSHGLIHLDPEKGILSKLTVADGLSDSDVRTITRDHHGGKWIGTMNGLSYLTPDNSKVLTYYGGHGLVERAVNRICFYPEGKTIYIGGDMGITVFMPDSVGAPGFSKAPEISALYLNGSRIVPDTRIGQCRVIEGSVKSPESLYLPYQDNALMLRVSTMDFRDASNVNYRWRLGKNEEWIDCMPGENMVHLPHLDPGNYLLEICAQENNEVSQPLAIRIVIATPWYQTWWANCLYVLIVVILAALAFNLFKKKKEEEANEEKIRFFMDISHDIRSPMTLILNPLESLMREPLEPGVKSRLEVMHRNAQRILGLVNQLLDIRKLEKGKMRLSCRMTDINEFTEGLVELFRPQAEGKGLTLAFSGSEALGDVWLDRDSFDKILVNLISNAIKYTPGGGVVDVRLEKVDDARLGACASVSVVDTGIGIDSKTQKLIFERFYRAREKHESATLGVGIGLDLSRRLAEHHHGAIFAKNREDGVKGSVFTVLIPLDVTLYEAGELVEGAVEPHDTARHLLPSGASADSELSTRSRLMSAGKKVLVVDDDAELRSFLRVELQKYYQVKEAGDGAEALRVISEWNPDIVVSDVVMSAMDGLTLLKRIKSGAESNHIPVVLLSSKTELADRMAGWEKGADGYIGKPFSMMELLTVVDTLIENRRRMRGKFSGAQDTEGKIDTPEMKGNDQMLIERIQKVINKNIDDPQFNVERLSDEVGVSRAQLHRKMKELIGMTPSDYIRNIRLRHACELLRRSDIEVTQVAYRIGFASQPHFSSHFKKYTGYSPSEYRARCLKGDEPDLDEK